MNDRNEEIRKLQERLKVTTPKEERGYGYRVSGNDKKKEFLDVFQTRAYTKPPEDKR
jgi:hypothetical protein